VWHRRYLGSISAGVDAVAKAHRPDLYLVTRPDLEWVQDGTRESNGFRREMHDWTIAAIEDAGIPYQIVSGDPEERLRQSIDVIEPFLQFQHLI
jgi:nicotinamide riboside kinase